MEAIDALKQKVLSLAIQGKLVAQDPTDEPASVLLDKIKAEKAELVKSSFDNVLAYIAEMELDPEDRYASIGDVTEHISQLLSQIMTEKN